MDVTRKTLAVNSTVSNILWSYLHSPWTMNPAVALQFIIPLGMLELLKFLYKIDVTSIAHDILTFHLFGYTQRYCEPARRSTWGRRTNYCWCNTNFECNIVLKATILGCFLLLQGKNIDFTYWTKCEKRQTEKFKSSKLSKLTGVTHVQNLAIPNQRQYKN
jgi:hypothetical protein